jgi:ribosomal protein S18 acetylase RimI-like enzyme
VIRRLEFQDAKLAREVAELHCQQITGGVLGILGPRFLGTLYRYIAGSQESALWVDVESQSLRGFICGCRDDKRMFRDVLKRGFVRLALEGFVALGRKGVISGVISTVRVLVGPSAGESQPRAQLLSIAVSERDRRKGVASDLVKELHQQFVGWGVDRALVWTTATNSAALSLYRSHGYVDSFTVAHKPEDMVGLVRERNTDMGR